MTVFISGKISAKRLLIEDFETTRFLSYLGKSHNTWTSNPDDPTVSCKAVFNDERDGFSLKIYYDIDSALDYFFDDEMYILDYSDYNIVGLSKSGMPHTAYCGYYFLLGEEDLTGYSYLVFYARGDQNRGYTRRFEIELKTADQTSSFIVDGLTNKWKKFVIPFSVFERIDDWTKVTEFNIVFNENVTAREGAVLLDNVYFTSEIYDEVFTNRSKDKSGEQPALPKELNLLENVGFNYRYTPEAKNEMFTSGSIILDGSNARVAGRIKASVSSQEFGQSGYLDYTDEYPFTNFVELFPSVQIPTVQLKVNNLTPLANRLTVGNIFLGYSQYVLSPVWGWKGALLTGRRGDYEHATFLVKRYYDSYSIGNRSLYYIGDHRIKTVAVYDSETAKLSSSSTSEGTSTTGDDNWEAKPVSRELSYISEVLLRFLNYRLNVEFKYGGRSFKQLASADYTDNTNPVYSHKVSSSTVNDNIYQASFFLNGLPVRGSKFLVSFRDVGTDFLPRYRQEPVIFEDVLADQRGYTVRLEQWRRGFNVNAFYDNIIRNSDSDYYRRTINFGGGYIGPGGLELSLNREVKREEYVFAARAINKNVEVKSIIAKGKYNFIYPRTPGLRLPMELEVTLREDRTDDRDTGKETVEHSLAVALNYQLSTDFGFAATYDSSDDNFNLFLNGNF